MLFFINSLFLISFWQQKRAEQHTIPRTEVIGWYMHESPSVDVLLTTQLPSLNHFSWGIDCLLTLWPLLIPSSLANSGCMFGFLIFIIVESNSLYNSLYIFTKRSLNHPCSTRDLDPRVFLSLSLLPIANSLECGSPTSSLSCLAFKTSSRGHLCLCEWFKTCSRVLVVPCENQWILASFPLSLSYRWPWTTRYWPIKGPQQRASDNSGLWLPKYAIRTNTKTRSSFLDVIFYHSTDDKWQRSLLDMY